MGSSIAPIYRLVPDASVARGDLVLARLPQPAARLAAGRGFLPLSVPVVKPVAALAGDLVCAQSDIVTINDLAAVRVLRADGEGRPLPA